MKNKKTLYILLPLVIVIWGLIIWKLVSYTKEDSVTSNQKWTQETAEVSDSLEYVIIANYSDPFLRNKSSAYIQPQKQTRITGITETRVKSLVTTNTKPDITYKGQIKSTTRTTAIVLKNDKTFLLSEGSILNDIKIVRIYPDSILVSCENKKFTYARN